MKVSCVLFFEDNTITPEVCEQLSSATLVSNLRKPPFTFSLSLSESRLVGIKRDRDALNVPSVKSRTHASRELGGRRGKKGRRDVGDACVMKKEKSVEEGYVEKEKNREETRNGNGREKERDKNV